MAAIRIRGNWQLTLSHYAGDGKPSLQALGESVLAVHNATRAGVQGEFWISRKVIPVRGRVKPGSPAVVTLHEVADGGEEVSDGLEAILYIPPWWPNVDYSYDFIFGTLVVGPASAAATKKLEGMLVSVSGVQPFE